MKKIKLCRSIEVVLRLRYQVNCVHLFHSSRTTYSLPAVKGKLVCHCKEVSAPCKARLISLLRFSRRRSKARIINIWRPRRLKLRAHLVIENIFLRRFPDPKLRCRGNEFLEGNKNKSLACNCQRVSNK